MSGLMGDSAAATSARAAAKTSTLLASYRVTTAVEGLAIPLFWGRAPIIIDEDQRNLSGMTISNDCSGNNKLPFGYNNHSSSSSTKGKGRFVPGFGKA
jgi:hypothetical protein